MSINLKKLLQKYHNHTATEEEITLIKEKIEEFNLLQEQSLLDEIPFSQIDSVESTTINTDKIKRQVNRKIIKLVSLIFIGFISFIILFYFFLVPVINHLYFNPNSKEKNASIPEFNLVSAVYTELTQPYLRLAYVTSNNNGVGTYQIEKGYSSVVSTNQSFLSNPSFTYTIKKGKPVITKEPSHNYLTAPTQLVSPTSDPGMYDKFKQQKLTKIKDLPSSSQINASFTFKKPLAIKDTFSFLESNTLPSESNYHLNWLSVANDELSIGIDWFGTFQILENKLGTNDPYLLSLNQTYPNLFPGAPNHQDIQDQSNALENHFLSSLSYVIDNQELLEMQESFYSPELLKKILTDNKKNGVKINGIYISGTPKAIAHFGSKDEVALIDVQSTELYSDSFSDISEITN